MKMIRDTFRKTGKATSVFFNLFFLKKGHSFADVDRKRAG